MSKGSLIAFVLTLAAVVAAVVLLLTGGRNADRADDPLGDVVVSKGPDRPFDLSLVDIRKVSISRDGADLLFEASMEREVPEKLFKQALVWRWEIYEGGQLTWLVAANVDHGPQVSVLSTQTDYQASTIDDLLPGSIERDGHRLVVRIEAGRIAGFPSSFEWLLKTSLDADRAKTTSALAEDQAPGAGYLRVEG